MTYRVGVGVDVMRRRQPLGDEAVVNALDAEAAVAGDVGGGGVDVGQRVGALAAVDAPRHAVVLVQPQHESRRRRRQLHQRLVAQSRLEEDLLVAEAAEHVVEALDGVARVLQLVSTVISIQCLTNWIRAARGTDSFRTC